MRGIFTSDPNIEDEVIIIPLKKDEIADETLD